MVVTHSGFTVDRFDLIAAGMFITPKRCEVVAFSDPSFAVGQQIITNAGNTYNLHSFADVAKNPAVVLGHLSGGASIDYAKQVKIPEAPRMFFIPMVHHSLLP